MSRTFLRTDTTRRPSSSGPVWFFPLLAVCAVALILGSMGGATFQAAPGPQGGVRDGGEIVFGPKALADGLEARGTHLRYVHRENGFAPSAVSIAVLPKEGPPSPAEPGARLLLTPAAGAALAGKPVRVLVKTQSLNVTRAEALAVSLQNDGAIQWVSQPLPETAATLTFDLPPAEGQPPSAIGFWVVSTKGDTAGGAAATYNYGVRILEVRAAPQG